MRVCVKIITMVLLLLLVPVSVMAAMEPTEVEKIHQEASIQVEGKVLEDAFHSFQEEKQFRTAKVAVTKVIKGDVEVGEVIPVRYFYVSSYTARESEGLGALVLVPGDEIEIYLEKENEYFTPVLHAYSVTVSKMVEERPLHEDVSVLKKWSVFYSGIPMWQKEVALSVSSIVVLLSLPFIMLGMSRKKKSY
ncbi:hypothetical protein [Mangrovibacillus cuniculi]|uniref:Uncharacterized protein n=1 Tax=Mangrovibacillus cuniculi TaxID=2593652 RepID=A0A7S8C9G7_9BACI|nr:hypothetical protein [Mangrovibacillus cuniculi]QPC45824.1 hypothetical protein G8O30_02050 [Mangrovibacillus cuniculi]